MFSCNLAVCLRDLMYAFHEICCTDTVLARTTDYILIQMSIWVFFHHEKYTKNSSNTLTKDSP